MDFGTKKISTDRHNIMIETSIHPEDLMIRNVYTPNNRASKYKKQKLIQKKKKFSLNLPGHWLSKQSMQRHKKLESVVLFI